MSDDGEETIRISDDGVELPVIEVLTGRGFVTGKSGSGKSNTANVIAEELLKQNFPLMIIDTDGEYYGLKEKFELLHVGADEACDLQINVHHAPKLAQLALEENVPIILDVSGYLDGDEANEIIAETVKRLFMKEKSLKKPFLLLVEEIHEYLPEKGGTDECGQILIRVAKRGRKHGLGLCGMSQRPANVKKDYITQCDWLVWHRLTWDNDTKVVARLLSDEKAEEIQDLDAGEAFLVTDWDNLVQKVKFRRKETFDAGATPTLDDFERPELKSVGEDLVAELQEISDAEGGISDEELADERVDHLREQLQKKERKIQELEEELDRRVGEIQELRFGDDEDAGSDVPAPSETDGGDSESRTERKKPPKPWERSSEKKERKPLDNKSEGPDVLVGLGVLTLAFFKGIGRLIGYAIWAVVDGFRELAWLVYDKRRDPIAYADTARDDDRLLVAVVVAAALLVVLYLLAVGV
jgi:hypothetical protein